MKKTKIYLPLTCLLICLTMLFNLSACKNAKTTATDLMQGVKSKDAYYSSSFKPTDEEYAAATDFALRLFGECYSFDQNTLVSPLSVMSALALTANGAKGETLSQMESALGMPVNKLNILFYEYLKSLPTEEKCTLKSADSVWFTDDKKFTVNKDFLQANAEYHGAGAYKVPFDETTLKDINDWVKKNTDGMITKMLKSIPDDAVMYLINAVAFDAEWQQVYSKNQVYKDTFTCVNTSKRKVEFMLSEEHDYLEDENAVGFIKYYHGGRYAFAALLPNEDVSLSDYVHSLDGKKVQELLKKSQSATVTAAIPKFEMQFDTELSKALKDMGMPLAFDTANADLSGIGKYEGQNLYISRVLHKTYISVAEKGTKAGAATVVEVDKNAIMPAPDQIKQVYLNRPFLYMLIDTETNMPFFIGTVVTLK